MEYKLSEQELKDLMHRTWLKAKKFYNGKTDEYFFDYFESEKKQLPIYSVSSSFKLGQTINIKQADGDFIIDAIGKDGCYAHNWETGETEWVEENDLLPI